MFWKSLSIRWRMVLILVVLPLLLLLPGFLFVGVQYRNAYRDARLGKGEILARQVEQSLVSVSPYISSVRDLPALDRYLGQSVEDEPEMAFAAVVRDDGFVLYHSVPGLSGSSDPVLSDVDPDTAFQEAVVPYTGLREVYLVSREIALEMEEGRSLYVVIAEYADLVDPPFLTWVPALAGIASALLLVILLQAGLSRLILAPLEQVAEGAALIGAGDLLYRIKVRGTDEIAFLARRFNDMARQLHSIVTTLEQQVTERTDALAQRSEHLEAVARVAREAVQVHNVPLLLDTTVNAISDHFGYYHTGIFLTDDEHEWAVLSAASSEGGQRMLARRHRLRVGEQGIVGTVTATGEPRIALDVGQDAVWFDTPELPDTRSEIALPLFDAGGEVVGALDVQSAQPEAFGPEDIETLQLLADQVSVAYQNARLLERTQSALAELSALQQEQSRRGWARVIGRMRPRAYEYDRIAVNPVLPLPVPDDGGNGGDAPKMVMDGGEPVVMEPMRYRGETVGYVSLSDPQRTWTDDELELIRSVSDQIAIALENARLFEDAQRTARSQALLNYVLNTASSRTQSTEDALHEITFILAQAMDMAVGIFTFPESDTKVVRLQALILPEGGEILSPGTRYELPTDLQLFFKGLEDPELGKLLPFLAEADLDESYEQERVLYVPIRTAAAQIGFMAMVQRQGDLLLDPETRALARSLAQQIAVVVENLRLLEETQRRSAELQALYEVSLQFGEELDTAVMNRLIVEQAVTLFDAESCGFFLYDERRQVLELSEVIGSLERYSDLNLAPGEGLSGVVFQQRKPLRVENYARWRGRVAEIEQQEFGPALGVPLLAAEEIRGVLYIAREPGRAPFDESDIRLAELFAAQAGVALENARLYQESARRAQELQELYEAGLDLVSRLKMKEVLEAGADWARQLLEGARAFVFYWDEEAGRYRSGYSRSAEMAQSEELVDFAMPREEGVTQLIRESGEIVLIHDALDDSRASPNLQASGMRSQIGGPLRFGRQVMGAIFVQSPETAYFAHEDGQLLEFLGSQIATAMENSQLFSRTQSALGVVADQARAQTRVAQATAMLTERGTQALNQVVRLLGEAADVDLCLYFDAREDSQGLYWRVEATWSRSGAEPLEMMTIRRDMIPHWFVDLQEGIVTDTVSESPTEERSLMDARGLKSVLGLPVRGEIGEIPGFLGFIDRTEERKWREEEITPLQTVAAALASTLAREHLFQQVQEALSETELLYEAGSALNVATSYDDILDVMRQKTILGERAAHVSIQLYNRPWTDEQLPEWGEVVARWSTLPGEQLFRRYRQKSFPTLIEVLSRDTLTVIRDLEDDPRVGEQVRALFFGQMGARSAIFVPLLVGGESIGFLAGLYPERMRFSGSEIRRLLNLATQAAVAIQNRYQIQATAARARREQLIREIAGQIQAAPDVQGVLETATRELGRVLRSPRTVIHLGGLAERRRRKLGTGPLPEEEGGDGASGDGQE